MENKFKFRELNSKDIFPMVTILNKIGFKELQSAFQGLDFSPENSSSTGMSIIFGIGGVILENLPKCENEIYTFLANVSKMKKEEIAVLRIDDFAEMIFEFVRKPEFKDFFKVVSRLFKSVT